MDLTFWNGLLTGGAATAVLAGAIGYARDMSTRRAARTAEADRRRYEWMGAKLTVLGEQLLKLAALAEKISTVARPQASWDAAARQELFETYCAMLDEMDDLEEGTEALASTFTDAVLVEALDVLTTEVGRLQCALPDAGAYRNGEEADWSPVHEASIDLHEALRVVHHRIDQLAAGQPVQLDRDVEERLKEIERRVRE